MNNQPIPAPTKMKFSTAITTKGYKQLIANTLTEPKRQARFIASITSAVGANPALQECDSKSIISGALLGESLNLSPSPQLGQFYLVPFATQCKDQAGNKLWVTDENGNKVKDANGKWIPVTVKNAQFILGYKGMLQLAMRSGYYKKIVVLDIKQGELIGFDPMEETIDCMLIEDPDEREKAPTIGYYAMFEYQNGFRKAIYWTQAKMMHHADRYSKAFSANEYARLQRGEVAEKDMWKYSSFWYTSFDDMAKKTMLRQLLSHWGMLSTEMADAFEADGETITNDGSSLMPEIDTGMDDEPQELPGDTDASQGDAGDGEQTVDIGSL